MGKAPPLRVNFISRGTGRLEGEELRGGRAKIEKYQPSAKHFDNLAPTCGSYTDIEVHHLKHIKTINVKLSFR